MRKIIVSVILIAAGLTGLNAQSYLNDILNPVSSNRYTGFRSSQKVTVAQFDYKGGFVLRTGKGGLISEPNPGFVVYDLGGSYSKLTFVMGPYNPNSATIGEDVIVTVKADGRRILDRVVRCYGVPESVTLDVTGVKELRFDLPRGVTDMAFGEVRLWKPGQTVQTPRDPQNLTASSKVKLVETLCPHYTRHSGYVATVRETPIPLSYCAPRNQKSMNINGKTFNSGLRFEASMQLDTQNAWSYFWVEKKFDKLSFILGPCDNQSKNATGWLIVKADDRIIYEKLISQTDLAEQVVLDIAGAENISFHSEFNGGDFLGGLHFGLADMYVWPKGSSSLPLAGPVNLNREKISNLPDVCPLMSTIKPYSVRGMSSADNVLFTGESDYYTFSMGGEKFSEGLILTTGNTFLEDKIDSYVAFDLAGEYDWISFKAGCLTNHRVLGDDIIQVWADDNLVLETTIHATWPNQYFELPINKCRILKFAKPGNGKSRQVYFGVGDIALYRGRPVANDLFRHEKPYCPDEADLIDLCKRPYFHYVGRYLSTITNFDFNDCFKNGSSQREYFQMKDGSKIYKGVMLETNIPLGIEDISLTEMVFMFVTGAGSSISSSHIGAVTGITAGAGTGGALASLKLMDNSGRQSSVAAFNPYGEYETCTFTVANKSGYSDPVDNLLSGGRQHRPVKLNVFADQRLVGEFWLEDNMSPTTYTVPINRCHQLMFWLECGETRSGQYVLYDMKVSKRPCGIPVPERYSSSGGEVSRGNVSASARGPVSASARGNVSGDDAAAGNSGDGASPSASLPSDRTMQSSGRTRSRRQNDEPAERVSWTSIGYSSNDAVNSFLRDVDQIWKSTCELPNLKKIPDYRLSQTWVEASDGRAYKCVSMIDSRGNRLSTTDIQNDILARISAAKMIRTNSKMAYVGLPGASLGVTSLGSIEAMSRFSKQVKLGKNVLSQCDADAQSFIEACQLELDSVQDLIRRAVDVDGFRSTAYVMIIPQEDGDILPEVMQQLRYFNF